MNIMAGKTKNYTDDFKKQIVALKLNGKSTSDIAKEYQIAKSTIIKWVNDYSKSGSFKAKDNRSDEENELDYEDVEGNKQKEMVKIVQDTVSDDEFIETLELEDGWD